MYFVQARVSGCTNEVEVSGRDRTEIDVYLDTVLTSIEDRDDD